MEGTVLAHPDPLSIQGTCLQGPGELRGDKRRSPSGLEARRTHSWSVVPILEGTRRRDTPGDRSHQEHLQASHKLTRGTEDDSPGLGREGWVKKVHTIQVNRFKDPAASEAFATWCNHHLYRVLKLSHHSNNKVPPTGLTSSQPTSPRPQPLAPTNLLAVTRDCSPPDVSRRRGFL